MRRFILALLLIILAVSLAGKEYSVRKAMLYSAVVPGLGEIYTRDYKKGAIFLTSEAAILFSYFRLKAETKWAVDSYKQFAYSVTDVPKDQEDSYYQKIQDYISSDNYNESIIRDARNYFLIYNNDPLGYEEYLANYLIPEDLIWDWENTKNWYKYRELRRNKQDFEIYTKFVTAAAILNRIVSMIDSAVSVKKLNRSGKYLGKLSFKPDYKKRGMEINYEYRF